MMMLVFFITSVYQACGDTTDAELRISQSEDSLNAAYLLLLTAERAGGDVSELIARFNTALEYYSGAVRALESGEYETAVLLAEKVIEASNMILEVDVSLIVVAERLSKVGFRNQLFLSFGVVCLTILFGFLGWRLFKGYYVQRMMGWRPEVVTDES